MTEPNTGSQLIVPLWLGLPAVLTAFGVLITVIVNIFVARSARKQEIRDKLAAEAEAKTGRDAAREEARRERAEQKALLEAQAATLRKADEVQGDIRRDVNGNMAATLKKAEDAAKTITDMTKAAADAAAAATTAAATAATAAAAVIQRQVDDFKAEIVRRDLVIRQERDQQQGRNDDYQNEPSRSRSRSRHRPRR